MDDSSDDEQMFMDLQTLHVPTPLIHSTKLSVKLDRYGDSSSHSSYQY